jgi:methylenetetrahydrofolate reductase (NADPH)
MVAAPSPLGALRYEVLPFAGAETEAKAVGPGLTLTVTCSPRHGMDATVDVACRLRELGHVVVPHVAARMIRGSEHLDGLLERMAGAGIADVYLIGGDAAQPLGPYASAVDLIGELRAHRRAPRTVGIAAYPEGHPLIDPDALADALRRKAAHADYMVTQLCFDPGVLLDWVERTREAGIDLPLYAGVPGAVDRRKLLEISLRVGVGGSVSFVRKQRGLRRLVSRPAAAAERLTDSLGPLVGGELGIAGLHFFTFNRLVETLRLAERGRLGRSASA